MISIEDAIDAPQDGIHEAILRRWRQVEYAADYGPGEDEGVIRVVDRETGKLFLIYAQVHLVET